MGASQLINVASQLIVPPLFIHFYGIPLYGEYLALTATASYLSTLNFGLTTYSTNQLSIYRQKADWQSFDELQASTQMMLLFVLLIALALSACFFLVPLPRLLHLTMPSLEASGTAFFLALQVIINLVFGYYNTLYTVIEQNHRALAMGNLRRFSGSFACVPLLFLHASMVLLAFAGFFATLLSSVWAIYALRRDAPNLPMGLKAAKRSVIVSILKPSAMFGLIYLQNILLFQAPVIIFQRLLGPVAVVTFTITRTIFGLARQFITILTMMVQPEITYSYGAGNKQKLLNIFLYTEKIVFAVIPVVNLGTLLLSPLLLSLWMHKPELFDLPVFCLMAAISAAMSMKEHKQNFQFSTNRHQLLSVIIFSGNVLLVVVGIPVTKLYGLTGFEVLWLIAEIAQMFLIYSENRKLFDHEPAVSIKPIFKLIANVGIGLPVCLVGLSQFSGASPMMQIAFTSIFVIALSAVSYFLYDLRDAARQIGARLHTLGPKLGFRGPGH